MRSFVPLSIAIVSLATAVESTPSQSAPTSRILVAYDSETGNTAAMAEAVAEGVASVREVEVDLKKVSDATDEEIRRSDGILLGTPVHWANLSARTKEFLDRVASVLGEPDWGEGRTAGAFCTAGAVSSGKELARISVLAAFLNMRFIVIGGLTADGFGSLGAQATTGPADPGVSDDERHEGRRSGARFARITRSIRASKGQ